MAVPDDPQLKSQRKPDAGTHVVPAGVVRFGDGSFPVLAGPGAVESEEQIVASAGDVRSCGGLVLRSATFLPDDIAGRFTPLGREGVLLLEHAAGTVGIDAATFVFEPHQVDVVVPHVDILEVGPSRMGDTRLLRAVGESRAPAIIHRGAGATVDEWLQAAETVTLAGGRALLCERGSDGHDPRTSGTLDISAVAAVQNLTDVPVLVNPAPVTGSLELIAPLALAARSAGADGLMVAVHPEPHKAGFRAGGHLDPGAFAQLMEALGIPSLRDEIDRIDRQILSLISRRLARSVDIGLIKTERGAALHSPDREAELITEVRADAEAVGMDPDYAEEVMTVILKHSRAAQTAAVDRRESPS
jgi:3-deoxy-7-phosphoheptulonate synthase